MTETSGPLTGIRIVEFAGIGPAPMCAMLMADLGADIVRITRPGAEPNRFAVEHRGRPSVELDLKSDDGREAAARLAARADALIEGFRPGVMERLGLGPDPLLEANPKLVYGRMTGWGQTGPLADKAGHDIDYIALTGALHAIGPAARPAIPVNLIGDFGGGALYLALGLVSAILHARETGQGQVVDCAMSDGAISLMGMLYGRLAGGTWNDARESNIIDGGAHFYNVYECADGRWMAVGAIEPKFYAALLDTLEIDDPDFTQQHDRARWPRLKEKLAAIFITKPRDEWAALFEASDACVAPVLSMSEAPANAHNRARDAFVERDGVVQPGVSPKFSATPGGIRSGPEETASVEEMLSRWDA